MPATGVRVGCTLVGAEGEVDSLVGMISVTEVDVVLVGTLHSVACPHFQMATAAEDEPVIDLPLR